MPRLTPIHYSKFAKFVEYLGCEFKRKSGSHIIYTRNDLDRPVVFPEDKELSFTVIMSNLKTLGISKEKFIEIMARIK